MPGDGLQASQDGVIGKGRQASVRQLNVKRPPLGFESTAPMVEPQPLPRQWKLARQGEESIDVVLVRHGKKTKRRCRIRRKETDWIERLRRQIPTRRADQPRNIAEGHGVVRRRSLLHRRAQRMFTHLRVCDPHERCESTRLVALRRLLARHQHRTRAQLALLPHVDQPATLAIGNRNDSPRCHWVLRIDGAEPVLRACRVSDRLAKHIKNHALVLAECGVCRCI